MSSTDLGRLSPSERALLRGIALDEEPRRPLSPASTRPAPTPAPPAAPATPPPVKQVVFFPVPVEAPPPPPRVVVKVVKPKAPRALPEPVGQGFDALRFHGELMAAARQLGVKTIPALAADTGVPRAAIVALKRGLAPSLATCLVLCDWAGMNPLQYLMRLAPAAANDERKAA